MGKRGPIDNWPAFWRYITSGTADPIGRPLSLLTFLFDGRNWPADPRPFLRTNVLLHLLNGSLLFCLLRRLGSVVAPPSARNDTTALLATGMWLLHPLFVSTTLYVIQREAMLPATLVLAGLWCYVDGRDKFQRSLGQRGRIQMIAAIMIASVLAMLAKANGILLPLLALVLTKTILASDQDTHPTNAQLRTLERWLLLLPSLFVCLYVLKFLPQINQELGHRPWTIGQRLLTEPRVVVEYLWLLAIPRSISTGLYNDGYQASVNWLHPATTLPALLFLLSLLAAAWHWRARHPRLSAGLTFFFAGHLLESTTIPLELYFEHRNYLPAMLLFWPLAAAIVDWNRSFRWRVAIAGALLLLFAFVTWQRAILWGQPDLLAKTWAVRNPDSPRARSTLSLILTQSGEPERAASLLLPLWQQKPEEVQLAFNYVNARCAANDTALTQDELAAVTNTLKQTRQGHLLIHQWLQQALVVADDGACPGLTLDAVERWILVISRNPAWATARTRGQDIEPLLGELAVYRRERKAAILHFQTALESYPYPDFAARLITFLAVHEQYSAALQLLDAFEKMPRPAYGQGMARLHALVLARQGFWQHEFAILRAKLQEEMAKQQAGGSSTTGSPDPQ